MVSPAVMAMDSVPPSVGSISEIRAQQELPLLC